MPMFSKPIRKAALLEAISTLSLNRKLGIVPSQTTREEGVQRACLRVWRNSFLEPRVSCVKVR